MQAVFDWHTDVADLALLTEDPNWLDSNCLRTVVVQLGAAQVTAMQIWFFPPHMYCGQGSAVMFDGACVHRSLLVVSASEQAKPVWKLAVFVRVPHTRFRAG